MACTVHDKRRFLRERKLLFFENVWEDRLFLILILIDISLQLFI